MFGRSPLLAQDVEPGLRGGEAGSRRGLGDGEARPSQTLVFSNFGPVLEEDRTRVSGGPRSSLTRLTHLCHSTINFAVMHNAHSYNDVVGYDLRAEGAL
jgi:hypothetical protein